MELNDKSHIHFIGMVNAIKLEHTLQGRDV